MKTLLALCILAILALPACTPKEVRLAKKISKSTVVLHVQGQLPSGSKGWGNCSGVYVRNNIILSAAHCFQPPTNGAVTQIWIRDIYGTSAQAFIVKIDKNKDLALIRTDLKGKPIRLAGITRLGETIYVVGNPIVFEFVVTKGIVSNFNLIIDKKSNVKYVMFDAAILPGNSGGPVFNIHGQLIGIVVRSTSAMGPLGAVGLGFAVDLETIKEFLKK